MKRSASGPTTSSATSTYEPADLPSRLRRLKAPDHPGGWLGRLKRSWDREEKLRFVAIGVYNTLSSYLIFVGLYLLLAGHAHYLVLLVMAHFLAVTNAFLAHKFLTFRAEGRFFSDFLRFNLAYAGVLAFSLAALPFLVEVCHLRPLMGQALLTGINMAGSYLLHKHVSFRRS